MTNRWIAVIDVSTSMIHRIGMSSTGISKPRQMAMSETMAMRRVMGAPEAKCLPLRAARW